MPGRECQAGPVFSGPKERNVFCEDGFRSAGPCGAQPESAGPMVSLSTPGSCVVLGAIRPSSSCHVTFLVVWT